MIWKNRRISRRNKILDDFKRNHTKKQIRNKIPPGPGWDE
jgi:hypothetical protein